VNRKKNRVFVEGVMLLFLLGALAYCSPNLILSWLAPSSVCASSEEGLDVPNFELPGVQTSDEKEYLGLASDGAFKIADIKASVVLIEIFSNVCPHCHKQAPKVNELYRAIEEKPELKDNIKMIGLGAGNTDTEMVEYKKKHNVPFPLFPDKYLSIAGPLGVMATPTFIGVRINQDGTLKEFYRKTGTFGEVPEFLSQVQEMSKLEQKK
jgi:peroxiredoxin